MTDQLPSKDQLCGQCHRPIHPSDSRRHFGFYVAHGEGRCVQLLQTEIETLTRKLDTCGLECSATLKSLAAENEELRRDLTRTESAHAVVMAENAHYKQVAADRESALRNCLLLAMRHARRDSDWEHIIRFCAQGGVEPSPLRTDCASCAGWRADQPPPVARTPDWCPSCTKPYAECRCNGVAR